MADSLEGPKTQKLVDPLEVLPSEVVIPILKKLTFRQCCCLLRVSKRWNSTLASIPELWKHLDLTPPAIGLIETDAVRSYVENARWDITSIIIGYLAGMEVVSVMDMVCKCSNVKELEIQSHRCKGRLWVETFRKLPPTLSTLKLSRDCPVSAFSVFQILQECKLLERIELLCTFTSMKADHPLPDVMPRLRSFSLGMEKDAFREEYLGQLLQAIPRLMPELRELRLHGLEFFSERLPDPSKLDHLRTLNMAGRGVPRILRVPPSIEYLKLEGKVNGFYGDVSNNFKSLTHIRGAFLTASGDLKSVRQFFQFPESLELLRMPLCSFATFGSKPTYTTKLHSLKIVDFSAATCMTLPRLTNWLSQTEARLSYLSLALVIFESIDTDDWRRFITGVDWEELTELNLTSNPPFPINELNPSSRNRSGQEFSRILPDVDDAPGQRSTESIKEVDDLADLINTYMPNLEVLNLTDCPVGISTIKALIEGNRGKLKKLIAVGCVRDEDFPELLKCGWGTGVKIYSARYEALAPLDKSKNAGGVCEEGSEQWGHVTPMRNFSEKDYVPFISLERDIDMVFYK